MTGDDKIWPRAVGLGKEGRHVRPGWNLGTRGVDLCMEVQGDGWEEAPGAWKMEEPGRRCVGDTAETWAGGKASWGVDELIWDTWEAEARPGSPPDGGQRRENNWRRKLCHHNGECGRRWDSAPGWPALPERSGGGGPGDLGSQRGDQGSHAHGCSWIPQQMKGWW